jgi:hypothetical protein
MDLDGLAAGLHAAPSIEAGLLLQLKAITPLPQVNV